MSSSELLTASEVHAPPRWRYLILGVVCMIMIANLQYGWTLFVSPIHAAHGWALSSIQFAFTIFVALETWGTPINGWIADQLGGRLGPRVVIGGGGCLVAVGWIINAYADTLFLLYLGSVLSGFGAGAVYCTAVGNAGKWFKDKRGLAIGLIAGGFGAGAALTILPIQWVIAASGYTAAFFWFGLVQGGVVIVASQFMRDPEKGEAPDALPDKVQKQTTRSYTPKEVLKSPIFWLLYLLDLLMCSGGLIVTAALATIGTNFGVAHIALFGTTTLAVALIFSNIMNGVARPFFGWVSDSIGHVPTMAIAFALGAVAYVSLAFAGGFPWGFVLFSGLVFFCWGEIFSLFPAMCTDLFGSQYATTNLSMLYTAKGAAAFLVPLGSIMAEATGNWSSVLYLAGGINVIAVVLVLTVLRAAEKRHHDEVVDAPAGV